MYVSLNYIYARISVAKLLVVIKFLNQVHIINRAGMHLFSWIAFVQEVGSYMLCVRVCVCARVCVLCVCLAPGYLNYSHEMKLE